jgi:hypothetical protein
MMDDESGISPTLEGEVTGKTLGEIMHAKEAALKRMKVPLDNVAWLIENDAYLTLSWMSQIYTIPIVKEFASTTEMMAYEKENDINHSELFGTAQDDGSVGGPLKAHYLPQLSLHLEDRDGKMMQSKKSKFYQVGMDKGQIHPADLKWRGIFKIIPRSIIDSSQELIKAAKMEMFNMLVPMFQFPPELVARAAEQIIKVNEEDPKDWLPDSWVAFLDGETTGAPKTGPDGKPLPPPPIPGATPAGPGGAPGVVPAAGGSVQNKAGLTPPTATTVVPPGQVSTPTMPQLSGGKGLFGRGL